MGTGVRGEHIVKAQNIALRVQGVSKRFASGEMHDSLRDFIPSMFRRLAGRARASSAARKEFWALQDVSFELNRGEAFGIIDRKSTRLNSSHQIISYAVFCLKKKRSTIHTSTISSHT